MRLNMSLDMSLSMSLNKTCSVSLNMRHAAVQSLILQDVHNTRGMKID